VPHKSPWNKDAPPLPDYGVLSVGWTRHPFLKLGAHFRWAWNAAYVIGTTEFQNRTTMSQPKKFTLYVWPVLTYSGIIDIGISGKRASEQS
jgi:hypothetical protein